MHLINELPLRVDICLIAYQMACHIADVHDRNFRPTAAGRQLEVNGNYMGHTGPPGFLDNWNFRPRVEQLVVHHLVPRDYIKLLFCIDLDELDE